MSLLAASRSSSHNNNGNNGNNGSGNNSNNKQPKQQQQWQQYVDHTYTDYSLLSEYELQLLDTTMENNDETNTNSHNNSDFSVFVVQRTVVCTVDLM
jgi:hypothetical protein